MIRVHPCGSVSDNLVAAGGRAMTPSEAYRHFCAGELGDDMDFVEWGIFWEMYQATEKLGSQR